jgi:signal transduction histidine kinase
MPEGNQQTRLLDLEATDFRLRTLLDETMASLALRAHSKRLELAHEVHPDVPDNLVGDPSRRQVPPGPVSALFVRVGRVSRRLSDHAALAVVEDHPPSANFGVWSDSGHFGRRLQSRSWLYRSETSGSTLTTLLIEFDTKQFSLALSNILGTRARSGEEATTTFGVIRISVT